MGDWTNQNHYHIRSGWNLSRMHIRKPLTDKKIADYERRGFYDAAYKEARKKLMEAKASKRKGNFVETQGRVIYSPR